MSVRAAVGAVLLVMMGCSPQESPEQRVTRLRQQYQISPTAVQSVFSADSRPLLAVDLLVVPQGVEGLDQLTLVLEILSAEDEVRASRRFTITTAGLARGVTAQVSALVPDMDLRPGEYATVELELVPPEEARHEYPEYAVSFN